MARGKAYSMVLGVIAVSFFLRVIGQAMVFFLEIDFLPPMAEWHSGFIPYPLLLACQIAILGVQVLISKDLWCGCGFFSPCLGRVLEWPCAPLAMCTSR